MGEWAAAQGAVSKRPVTDFGSLVTDSFAGRGRDHLGKQAAWAQDIRCRPIGRACAVHTLRPVVAMRATLGRGIAGRSNRWTTKLRRVSARVRPPSREKRNQTDPLPLAPAPSVAVSNRLSVLFVLWPHSSQTYETSTRPGVKTIGVVLTNRMPDLQMGQVGAADTKFGRTPVEADT